MQRTLLWDQLLRPTTNCSQRSVCDRVGGKRPFSAQGCLPSRRQTTPVRAQRPCSSRLQSHKRTVQCAAGDQGGPQKSTEFGYSRKDVLLIGFGIFGGGFALYYGLQAAGVPPGYAGNYVQLFVVLGLCVGWIGSYIFRVANKDMTYVKQLQNYEEEVMQKRLEEMPENEREKLLASVEAERERRQAREQQPK